MAAFKYSAAMGLMTPEKLAARTRGGSAASAAPEAKKRASARSAFI